MTNHRFGGGARPRMAVAPLALLVACPALMPSARAADALPATSMQKEDATRPPTRIEVNRFRQRPSGPERALSPLESLFQPHDNPAGAPATDAGDFLRSVPGVTGGRMGGHGIDVVIRGQSQDRLAIVNDGAYAFGGCPNRMDPPTALLSLDSIDQVVVQRGYQSVTNGPPAPAGTVSFERKAPAVDAPTFQTRMQAGVDSNAPARFGGLSITGNGADGYARAYGNFHRADNYEDGAGRSVRSAYNSLSGGLETGWRYAPGSEMGLSFERTETEDVLFSGAGMDAPEDSVETYRFSLDHAVTAAGPLTGVSAQAYWSGVDHVMDNYSLRTAGMMKMLTETESDTYGGRLAVDLTWGETAVELGVDHRTNTRVAYSYSGMTAMTPTDPTLLASYMWPDVSIADTGLFGEATVPLGQGTVLTAGARADIVRVEAGKADATVAGGMGLTTARQLYAATYGTSDTDADETNLSGVLRVTHDFGPVTAWAGASRSVRTADATERGIVRFAAGSNGWVGNPGLDPEKHHQLDVGVKREGTGWAVSLGGWVDEVDDFITRDTARGQSGVLRTDGASIFRNIDARLAGAELSAEVRPWRDLALSGTAAYTWGENTTDNRPLYQIPPLQGSVEVAWAPEDWTAGTRMRWALRQGRVDMDAAAGSGLDVRETPGYAAFDLFASYGGLDGLEIRGGVTNLFDQVYANHLSRSNGVDPQMVQVNEPGRSFYLQGVVEF